MATMDIIKLAKKLKKEQKTAESYNTGLVGEQLIVASYKTMDLDKLEKMRFIINKIIKQKKELKRVQSQDKQLNSNDTVDSMDKQTSRSD